MTTGEMCLSTLVCLCVDFFAIERDSIADIPFLKKALSKGCASVEADVWLYNGTLYVRLVSAYYSVKYFLTPSRLVMISLH